MCPDSGKHGMRESSAELFFKNFRNGSKWSKYNYVRVLAYSEQYFSRYDIVWKIRISRRNSAEFIKTPHGKCIGQENLYHVMQLSISSGDYLDSFDSENTKILKNNPVP